MIASISPDWFDNLLYCNDNDSALGIKSSKILLSVTNQQNGWNKRLKDEVKNIGYRNWLEIEKETLSAIIQKNKDVHLQTKVGLLLFFINNIHLYHFLFYHEDVIGYNIYSFSCRRRKYVI